MDEFHEARREYVSARANCSFKCNETIVIKISITYYNGVNRTLYEAGSNEGFWQTLCEQKGVAFCRMIPRIQQQLLGSTEHRAADLVRDIVFWIKDGIYKKCTQGGLWDIIHSDL